MSHRHVATLTFAGDRRAYTLEELQNLAAPPRPGRPEAPDAKQLTVAALKRFDGNVSHAAHFLGVSRGTVYARCKRYGIALTTLPREITCATA